jgi:mannitol/fructose-specific phosphotransferase system IIA component (Ntr-type)
VRLRSSREGSVDVSYFVSAYCKNWEELVNNAVSLLVKSQEIVADYKAKMSAEEQLSRKTKRK